VRWPVVFPHSAIGMKLPSASVGGPGGGFGLVGLAGVDGFGHFVVNFEDGFFGDVAAFFGDFAFVVFDFGTFDVFTFDDGKGFHDVFDGVAWEASRGARAIGAPLIRRTQIEMKVRGIQFAPQQKPTILIPTEQVAKKNARNRSFNKR